ncbi:phosphatase PAP2 family protein [uncultured Piscinibacter sp.]|uniref:phosphatase PAP2 family protein n=1 Tax=uncultured Piscinibacter sp. TaxID=1131835 RepID=UPI00261751DE|nr:phosphatase PAP2 family protein [uncultured Piscinibacter sp.]
MRKTVRDLVVSVGWALCGVAPAQAFDHERAGDLLQNALPAGVAAVELWRGDHQGVWQLGASFAVTVLATKALKGAVRVERPDGSSDDAFPSGHASRAFVAATYMHRRHGWESAWPWYAAATYVGWTRVHADRHRWRDVAGSLALAGLSSWWLVAPAQQNAVALTPTLAAGRLAVELHARW